MNSHNRQSHQHRFDSYLNQFRRRYKLRIVVTAIAAVIFSVLVLSLFTAVLKESLADSNWLYYPARLLLLLLPIVIVVTVLWKPFQRFKKTAGSNELEYAVPEFDGRVDTYLDMKRQNSKSPFVGLLAKDASKTARKIPVKSILPTSEVMGPVVASIGMLAIAGWLFTSLPLDWRASMKQLWLGWFVSDILPERTIAVAPGDTKIRMGDSLFITATLSGFESDLAELHVRKNSTEGADSQWETVDMNLQDDGSFSFTLYGLSDPIDYYISTAFTESEHSRVEVVIPAKITSITHEYFYPAWTGLESTLLTDATVINTVEGTRVDVTFETDKPLQTAAVLHNNIEVPAEATTELRYQASIQIDEDGEYQLVELQDTARIPLSPKHQITITEDTKPTVAFNLPGGDWSATPIEEVVVAVTAEDDFALESVTLNYSVNGAEWQQLALTETNQFEHLFMLEEFHSETGGPLIAGDLVSYYAEAKDREQSVSTDMMFIDIRPFERRFTQSQQSGGGGGGGQQQQEQEISQRQKEILVSTFNLIRDAKTNDSNLIDPEDTATLLSDLQNTLADQADKLAERAEARQLLNEDPDIARFVEYMQEAAESMRPSAQSLALQDFDGAVKHQQKALQYLKRAESIFNDITINRGSSQSGGGGGASRDMAEMYELEMDLAKNQYETPDTVAENNAQQQSADEAFDKLKELARRQQELADAATRNEEQSQADRWQQEKLRRELEELQKELQQLQRQNQSTQQADSGQQGQQASSSQGEQTGSSSSSEQAMQSIEEAIQELKRSEQSASNMTPEERQQAAKNASEKLRQSLEQTADGRQQELQQQIADAAGAVRELSQQQQQISEELRQAVKRSLDARKENRFESGLSKEQEQRLAEDKRQLQRDLESIKQQLDDTSKRFAESAPLTTESLDQAVKELEDNQIAELLGISGDMIEEGMAPQAALREERINNALRNLQTDLFESSSLAAAESSEGNESDITAADATRTLQQLRQALSEALARSGRQTNSGEQTAELEQLERGNTGQSSDSQQPGEGSESSDDQSDQNQQGQQGQQGDGAQGDGQQGQGQQGQAGQNQQGQTQSGRGSSGNQPSGQLGNGTQTWSPSTGDTANRDVPINDGQMQLIEESITRLQQMAGAADSELTEQSRQDLNDLSKQLQVGNGEENNRRIEAEVRLLLRQLEQLELQIYNESKTTTITRAKPRVADPKGFDRQTSDYFRRLSEPAGS